MLRATLVVPFPQLIHVCWLAALASFTEHGRTLASGQREEDIVDDACSCQGENNSAHSTGSGSIKCNEHKVLQNIANDLIMSEKARS